MKLHHALSEGTGAARLMLELLVGSAEQGASAPVEREHGFGRKLASAIASRAQRPLRLPRLASRTARTVVEIARASSVACADSRAKRIHEALDSDLLGDWAELAPPALLRGMAASLRIASRARPPFNVLISNMPGPEQKLSVGGATVGAAGTLHECVAMAEPRSESRRRSGPRPERDAERRLSSRGR